MKLPRDVSGKNLVRSLKQLGYEVARQTGSHIRLTLRHRGKEHHITIPAHSFIKIGTLAGVLADVAQQLGMTRSDLLRKLS